MARLKFRDMPIARKLLLLAFLTTGIALLSFTTFSMLKEAFDWTDTKIEDMASDADIIGNEAADAVNSVNTSILKNHLTILWNTKEITYGALYDSEGHLVTEAGRATPRTAPAGTIAPAQRRACLGARPVGVFADYQRRGSVGRTLPRFRLQRYVDGYAQRFRRDVDGGFCRLRAGGNPFRRDQAAHRVADYRADRYRPQNDERAELQLSRYAGRQGRNRRACAFLQRDAGCAERA